MVKTPRTRHYKPKREPVTIDLQATEAESPPHAAEDEVADPGRFEPWVTSDEVAEETAEAVAADEVALETSDSEAGTAAPSTGDASEARPEAVDVQPETARYGRRKDDQPPPESTDTTGRTSPDKPATPAPARRSGLSSVAAGLIGGVSALVLAGLLQYAGILGAPGNQTAAPTLEPALGEIAALKSEVEALKAAPAADSGTAVADLATSLDQAKADIAALQSAVQSGSGGDGAAVGALDAKVKELEAKLGQLAQSGQGVSQQAVDGLGAKVATLEQSVSSLNGKVDTQAAQPRIALAISAAALKSTLDRGSAFTAELETFAAIAPDAPEIAPLRQYAETGVMTRADIAKAFPDAANAMVAAVAPADQGAGFFQRLLSSAESVVKVRPIGDVAGEEPPARVARMEVAVNAGEYDKALAEFAALPEAVQAAGAPLVDKIKARVEVEKLVDQMIAGAMKAA